MKSLGYSHNTYTNSWPPVSGMQKSQTQRRKPHSNASTIIPSGIRPKKNFEFNIPDDIGLGVTTGYNSSYACDCNQLTSKIEKLTDENRTLNDMLDSHINLEKNKKNGGSSRRFKRTLRRSIRRRKSIRNRDKYRHTRVRS